MRPICRNGKPDTAPAFKKKGTNAPRLTDVIGSTIITNPKKEADKSETRSKYSIDEKLAGFADGAAGQLTGMNSLAMPGTDANNCTCQVMKFGSVDQVSHYPAKRITSDLYQTGLEKLMLIKKKSAFIPEPRLCLPTQKGFTIVKLEDIVYCEAQRSYTRFHFINNKSITVSRPLFDYDILLSGTAFFRIHKSFLINLMHMKEYTRGEGGTVNMSNGMELEVSRRKKEEFLMKVKGIFRF